MSPLPWAENLTDVPPLNAKIDKKLRKRMTSSSTFSEKQQKVPNITFESLYQKLFVLEGRDGYDMI